MGFDPIFYYTRFSSTRLSKLLTQDAGDSLLVAIDRMFSLDPRPKTDRDRIYYRGLDFVNDLYAPNDPNCDVALMLRPVSVWPWSKRNRTA